MPTFKYSIQYHCKTFPRRNHGWKGTPGSRILTILLMGWWLGMGSVSLAEAADKPPEVQRLQTFMDRLKSVTAEFDQQALDADADQPKESHGQFFAARPGRFRWDYTTPYKQMLVSDGQIVWFYEPDLQQVTRSSAVKLNKSPAGFLTSGKRLEEIFTWEVVPGPDQDPPSVLLRPLQEGSLHWISISMHPQREEITNFVVEDSLNHRSRIRFQNWRANPDIPAERFRFEVPNGVDVIDHKE